ncbi:hypothetical protein QWY90_11915 [Flavobacterium paronense]|uniref:Uncharacterized protein n=1 Tax=Flavobacterium paronense TaxID=1392775 RepID=A0ABV5GDR0_9FLAO|nr:hypothetical protein [Flavobacterium paronense]MDN3678012.1 hypothetical protein [Flavobacterium paronense]
MKTIVTLFSFFFFLFSADAQQVQWANKLIKYSSDLGGKQFGIKRILGKPDAFPQAGNSPNAWTPKKALDGYEWVEVSFEKPQTVKQVAVFENLNAGCVVKIGVDTGSGKYETVWSRKTNYKTPTFKATIPADHAYYFKRKRRKVQEAPDVLNPGIEHAIIESAVSGVVAVRVEFNFALLPGQKQIDAIGISDSETPLDAKINTNEAFDKLQPSTTVALDGITPTNPTLTSDGKKMYITAVDEDKDLIYSFSKNADGSWGNKTIETVLNTGATYNYIDYASADFLLKGGNKYDKGTNETGYEIFSTKNATYEAVGPIKVTAYNNYEDTSDATMTADGKVLIMCLETDFTQGGIDLYFAQQKEDGTYGFLQNMGKIINSGADEDMAQLLSDQKTLLFSSNGFSGYGNFDIYVSYRLDDTWKNWSEPINLGSKINSSEFDGLPYYDEKNETLYFITSVDGINVLKSIAIPKNKLTKQN